MSFHKISLKLAIKSLLDNSHFTFTYAFIKFIGIPMGPDPDPFMENWKTYIWTIVKGSGFFRPKKRHAKGSYNFKYFQVYRWPVYFQ